MQSKMPSLIVYSTRTTVWVVRKNGVYYLEQKCWPLLPVRTWRQCNSSFNAAKDCIDYNIVVLLIFSNRQTNIHIIPTQVKPRKRRQRGKSNSAPVRVSTWFCHANKTDTLAVIILYTCHTFNVMWKVHFIKYKNIIYVDLMLLHIYQGIIFWNLVLY